MTKKVRKTTRDIYQKLHYQFDKDGNPVKVHVGKETIRQATCPKDQRTTTTRFEGVNEYGLLFRCGGGRTHDGHLFTVKDEDVSGNNTVDTVALAGRRCH